MTIAELVEKYIQCRDKKAEYKAEYDLKVAKVEEAMDKIENKFLEVFASTGMESIRTEFGTAFASSRTSCTVADKEVFMDYVIKNQEWPLLEVKPAKKAVEEFKTATDELPPGLNWTVERVVSVRRS
jgi:hypothetical protein